MFSSVHLTAIHLHPMLVVLAWAAMNDPSDAPDEVAPPEGEVDDSGEEEESTDE